ncbi:hypothetical protein PENTCL1PPCAC_8280 [Pristionchus entomophagus]|uniref:Uncharacterized protein n=1 Tax=Pristionchus entomophagus TaxID=358040 RepID=A0AAV5SSQ4_9BILA|nr:hypothetical protein PENTCL1PPCAC_8280 [Pristionchus entomophagus]
MTRNRGAFVTKILDKLSDNSEIGKRLEEWNSVKIEFAQEQFRLYCNPNPIDFPSNWMLMERRYHANLERRKKRSLSRAADRAAREEEEEEEVDPMDGNLH